MKILILALPRTGSGAYCSLYENDLGEYMNIEQSIIPRYHSDINKVQYVSCSQKFLEAYSCGNFQLAYQERPKYEKGCHFITYNGIERVQTEKMLSQCEFMNLHETRWNNLRNFSIWCVKIMPYNRVKQEIISDMILNSDRCVKLERKNKFDQVMSLTKCKMTGQWKNATGDAGIIDYDIFEKSAIAIRDDIEYWKQNITNYNINTLYYEELDLSKSNHKKSQISILYDESRCIDIFNKYFEN